MSRSSFPSIPYPSHVFVPSFVSVKLSGSDTYGVWKTQMLYLLESHDMLGFIDGTTISSMDDYKIWKRSDALVGGWILGSLSEQAAVCLASKLYLQTDLNAKNIWDQVESMYGNKEAADEREVSVGGACWFQDLKPEGRSIDREMKSAEGRAKKNKQLYVAAERERWEKFDSMLQKSEVKITDKISTNNNTALHLAVARTTTKGDFVEDDFLENILKLIPTEISLLNVRNSDGSTLLHLAASLGNTYAAKILVAKNRELLYAKDNEGFTPLDIVFYNPNNSKHNDMCTYMLGEYDQNATSVFVEPRGEEPLVNAISCRNFKLAMTLIKRYDALKSDAVLMAIAQRSPSDFSLPESILHELLNTDVHYFVTRGSLDIESCGSIVNQGCIMSADFSLRLALVWLFKKLITQFMKLEVFKTFNEKVEMRKEAILLLDSVCGLIKFSNVDDAPTNYRDIYSKPVLECIRLDASYVLERIVFWFPDALKIVDEDGNNIVQAAWRNRALKVYSLLVDGKLAKHTNMSTKLKEHPCGNNFLHFAARLGPTHTLDLISGPPFQLQRELRWFKAAKTMVPQGVMEKNTLGETPKMVFTREHKELVVESGKWMKSTANAYIITAILIITVVFAAAVEVRGGFKEKKEGQGDDEKKGKQKITHTLTFIVFVVSIAISMVTSITSLLFFLSILTSRLSQKDFYLKLPLMLVIGLVNLLVSATFMMFAFAATLFLIFGEDDPWTLGIIVPLIGQPLGAFAIYQSSLVFDLIASTRQFKTISGFRGLKVLDRIYV